MSKRYIELELNYDEVMDSDLNDEGNFVIEIDLEDDRLIDKKELKDLKAVYSLAVDYVLGLPCAPEEDEDEDEEDNDEN